MFQRGHGTRQKCLLKLDIICLVILGVSGPFLLWHWSTDLGGGGVVYRRHTPLSDMLCDIMRKEARNTNINDVKLTENNDVVGNEYDVEENAQDVHDDVKTDQMPLRWGNYSSIVYDSDLNEEKDNGDDKKKEGVETEEDLEGDLQNSNDIRPLCPKIPPGLIGNIMCICKSVPPHELLIKYPFMKSGGHLEPTECRARQRVAIIIPFRDRHEHLYTLLNELIPLLRKQQADATFFIVEQEFPHRNMFNRATLQNIGFLESLKVGNYSCFIFHDVDLVPLNDNLLYRCAANPRHFALAIRHYGRREPRKLYAGYFGGIVAFSKKQYQEVNGNSNLYFGWGGEDDDLLERVLAKKYKRIFEDEKIAKYMMLRHERNDRKRGSVDRMLLLRQARKRIEEDGLPTTYYTVNSVRRERLYTWINVSINATRILQAAPAISKSAILSTLELLNKPVNQTRKRIEIRRK